MKDITQNRGPGRAKALDTGRDAEREDEQGEMSD